MIKRILLGVGLLYASTGVFAQHVTAPCGTDEYNKELKALYPQIEANENKFKADWETYKKSEAFRQVESKKVQKAGAPKYIIPVVVHIFYGSKNGSENISDAQVQSEINFLNKSFRNLNSDTANRRAGIFNGMPFDFKQLAGDAEIEFRLARKDPNGNCTNGIVRVQSSMYNSGNDNLKKTSVWDTKRYFNIWVVKTINRGPGLAVAGYAQFPAGGGAWSALTDGIMVINNEFGNIGTSSPGQTPNVTTTTHETGHWLGLYHPFQATDSCEMQNDGVDDTPPTYFAPSNTEPLRNRCNFPEFNTCGNDRYDTLKWDRPDMQENFMDYFIGNCASNMFTKQQIARMHFSIENYRSKLVSYQNLVETGVLDPVTACAPTPAFGLLMSGNPSYERQLCIGTTVNFNDLSYNGTPTSWAWDFGEGATPQTSNIQNPTNISYTTPGYKTITLTVTNVNGSNTKTFTNAILVNQSTPINYHAFTPDYPELKDGWEFIGDETANWDYTELGAYSGYKGLILRGKGPSSNMYGKEFILISPPYDFTNATNPHFSFWYAYAQNATTGAVTSTPDALSVQYTTNCGLTWNNLKAPTTGAALATTPSVLSPTVNFVPNSSHWKQMTVLSSSIPKQANVRFRLLYSYQGGNNLYIDGFQMGLKTGLNDLTANDISLSVVPNPFNASANIEYNLPIATNTAIELFDITGRSIGEIFNGKQQEGNQSVAIDRTTLGLNAGIYFIKIKIEGSTITQKVVIY